jgi:hypothetical protein
VVVVAMAAVAPGGADAHAQPVRPRAVMPRVCPDVGHARGLRGTCRIGMGECPAHAEDDSAKGHQAGDGAKAPATDREAAGSVHGPKASRAAEVRFLLPRT